MTITPQPDSGVSLPEEQSAHPPSTVTEAFVQLVLAQYGDRLDKGQVAAIRDELGRLAESLEKLRAYPLDNSDQPDFSFHVYGQEPAE